MLYIGGPVFSSNTKPKEPDTVTLSSNENTNETIKNETSNLSSPSKTPLISVSSLNSTPTESSCSTLSASNPNNQVNFEMSTTPTEDEKVEIA